MITIIEFQNYPIRFVGTPDNPLWVAKDVCDCLDIKNHRMACNTLDEDEKESVKLTASKTGQSVLCVNESGLYGLILQSRKPSAKVFRKWVTKEVLPSIRKTGSYSTDREKQVDAEFRQMIYDMIFDGLTDREISVRLLLAHISGAFDLELAENIYRLKSALISDEITDKEFDFFIQHTAKAYGLTQALIHTFANKVHGEPLFPMKMLS